MRARDNPFAVQRVLEVRYRLSGLTWEELLERLAAFRFRAALVGARSRRETIYSNVMVAMCGMRCGRCTTPARTDPDPRSQLRRCQNRIAVTSRPITTTAARAFSLPMRRAKRAPP